MRTQRSARRRTKVRAMVVFGVAALVVLAAGVALFPTSAEEKPQVSSLETPPMQESTQATAREPRVGAPRGAMAPPLAHLALHEALGEDAVEIPSSVVIESLELDRPWVCAGDAIRGSARTGGETVPGAVTRWAWMTAEDKAEIAPGPAIVWTAPERPGRYTLHFEVCRDLGGRSVGVLAERAVVVDVRACDAEERQAQDLLHLRAFQRRHGAFAFEAAYGGDEPIAHYVWDFGDGSTQATTEAHVEHTYSSAALGTNDVASFQVTLEARGASGTRLRATTLALARGGPPAGAPLPVGLEVSRWRPSPDGNGWQSAIEVTSPAGKEVAWDDVERITKYFDDRAESVIKPWSDMITVDERLERGGFRGRVLVSASEAGPGVKQIIDVLSGHDAGGEEIVVSWTPFKRETPQDARADASH